MTSFVRSLKRPVCITFRLSPLSLLLLLPFTPLRRRVVPYTCCLGLSLIATFSPGGFAFPTTQKRRRQEGSRLFVSHQHRYTFRVRRRLFALAKSRTACLICAHLRARTCGGMYNMSSCSVAPGWLRKLTQWRLASERPSFSSGFIPVHQREIWR